MPMGIKYHASCDNANCGSELDFIELSTAVVLEKLKKKGWEMKTTPSELRKKGKIYPPVYFCDICVRNSCTFFPGG